MTAIMSAGVERWRQRFSEDAVVALDAALVGRMSLGQYDRAEPSEALSQLLRLQDIPLTDDAMQKWLEQHLAKPMPDDLTPKSYADALVEAFRTIQLLPLPNTRNWCAERSGELRMWLRGFRLGSSRDPEAALLVALAYQQNNRSLMFTWHEVIRRGRPVEHVRHALMGLRLMPADDAGAVERGLPRALLRGLLDYGETLVKSGDKEGKSWLEELDFLAAVYPMSPETWSQHFRDVLQVRAASKDVCNWLYSRFPVTQQHDKASSKGFLKPPNFYDQIQPLLQRVQNDFSGIRPALTAVLEQHRRYAQKSGDSFYLTQTFRNVGEHLLEHDPTWVRELAHEAARWEPTEHRSWSLLARALEKEGDWRRAEAMYWNARRRFPHNAQSHTQLGHALLLHGQEDLGEIVLRQATLLFPDNPITWSELGHSLHVTGNYEQAVAVYKEAQQMGFNCDPIIATALTDTLTNLNRLDEAETALQWAEKVVPNDDKSQKKLIRIRQRFNQAKNGTPSPPRQLTKPKEITGGNLHALADITGTDLSHAPLLGRASLWRRQGNDGLAKAREELNALHDGSAKLIELGLLVRAEQNWQVAAQWFNDCWQNYAGDGALQVHRLRAKHRAGEQTLDRDRDRDWDWAWAKSQYPELSPVIITEEQGRPPSCNFDLPYSELSQDQKQQLWFSGLAGNENLRDWVEEDFLSARQVA